MMSWLFIIFVDHDFPYFPLLPFIVSPLQDEKQKSVAKKRNRKRKDLETKEQRDQCNKRRRERYMTRVIHPNLLYY